MSKQLVTVTFKTEDNVDAAKLVEGLAQQARGLRVQVSAPVYGTADEITFVKAEQVDEPATAPATV